VSGSNDIIVVHWHDAGAGSTPEEAKSHFRESVGFEVENSPGEGVLIQMESDGLSHDYHFIPWPYIKRIERIKRAETPETTISEE